jgi:hypothetical protein
MAGPKNWKNLQQHLNFEMKRIKVNTSWEEDEEERLKYFAGLSYSERLRHYFKLRNLANFDKTTYPKGKIFKVYRSHGSD